MKGRLFVLSLQSTCTMLLLLSLFGCRQEPNATTEGVKTTTIDYYELQGRTMGTTYSLSYPAQGLAPIQMQRKVDSLLQMVNLDVSTYIDTSAISRFNRSTGPFPLADSPAALEKFLQEGTTEGIPHPHFLTNILRTKKIHTLSKGNFDPTVMPLVQYWGFGTEKRPVLAVDSLRVDSLKGLVGYSRVSVNKEGPVVLEKSPGVQLDFSASAKGYGVDKVCDLMEAQGIEDYFVEIGGEVRVKGKSKRGDGWRTGISKPRIGAKPNEFIAIVQLSEGALATSGNYRNYYESEGRIYGHTINPITGYPESSALLGVSVLADDCQTADAFATAFMVMGVDSAYAMASRLDEVEAFFVYGEEGGKMATKYTPAFEKLIRE
ncbi:MAG: FAD:protein FMN transferase [Bacteroidota bacterium]